MRSSDFLTAMCFGLDQALVLSISHFCRQTALPTESFAVEREVQAAGDIVCTIAGSLGSQSRLEDPP